jgi:hypothetical protein
MFDPDVSYGDAIEYALNVGLPPIGDEIQAKGGTVADGTCAECGGVLYDYEFEVVCGNCSLVIGSDTKTTESDSPWQRFWDNRPTHTNSGDPRCVGGFPQQYDWVKREDIDRPVKKLDPDSFYR